MLRNFSGNDFRNASLLLTGWIPSKPPERRVERDPIKLNTLRIIVGPEERQQIFKAIEEFIVVRIKWDKFFQGLAGKCVQPQAEARLASAADLEINRPLFLQQDAGFEFPKRLFGVGTGESRLEQLAV